MNAGGGATYAPGDTGKVIWIPPEPGWIKINFDGSSKGKLGISGLGAIAQDMNGDVLVIAANKIQLGTNNQAEAHAALIADKLDRFLNGDKIHLEGDSTIVMEVLKFGHSQT